MLWFIYNLLIFKINLPLIALMEMTVKLAKDLISNGQCLSCRLDKD